jgi:hypothetical protein
MSHAWRGAFTGFWLGDPKVGDQWEDLLLSGFPYRKKAIL